MYNVVLYNPEIPQNTGNIGRLCVSTNTKLHLIKPLSFDIDDKAVRRAGLDYWKHLDLHIYEDWNDFLEKNPNATMYFFSTKTEKIYWECPYEDESFFIYGSEGKGLPPEFYETYKDQLYTIPMQGEFCRSLNLANSVSITLFEGIRLNAMK